MPEMTAAMQVNFAERLSRTPSNALSTASTDSSGEAYVSDVTRQYIGMGVDEFAKEARLSKQAFVTVTPKFWADTNWYAQITIVGGSNTLAATNVSLASSTLAGVSGSTYATHIASNINAYIGTGSINVSWDDDTWMFTIKDNTVASITAVTVEPPDVANYIDGTSKTFGKTGTQSDTEWVSAIPEDCTLETDLPDDFLEMEYVDYDDHILYQAPFEIFMSPESQSDYPNYYAIRDRKLYLSPTPADRRMLKIRYRWLPTPVTITGSGDTATCDLPVENHMAPVYYAAGMILRETFEPEEANNMFGLYYDQVRKYRIRQANQNPKMFPKNIHWNLPNVDPGEE